MPGPYSKSQEPSGKCGCYYPDITTIKDERRGDKIIRTLYCIYHGYSEAEFDASHISKKEIEKMLATINTPTDKWREIERERIRSCDY